MDSRVKLNPLKYLMTLIVIESLATIWKDVYPHHLSSSYEWALHLDICLKP